jgi:hypothetical protein
MVCHVDTDMRRTTGVTIMVSIQGHLLRSVSECKQNVKEDARKTIRRCLTFILPASDLGLDSVAATALVAVHNRAHSGSFRTRWDGLVLTCPVVSSVFLSRSLFGPASNLPLTRIRKRGE